MTHAVQASMHYLIYLIRSIATAGSVEPNEIDFRSHTVSNREDPNSIAQTQLLRRSKLAELELAGNHRVSVLGGSLILSLSPLSTQELHSLMHITIQ